MTEQVQLQSAPAKNKHPGRIQVSLTKKPLNFYINLAKRLMQEQGEIQLSALGTAIGSMVTVAEILKKGQFARETKLTTYLDERTDGGEVRAVSKPKMEILMAKTPQFDDLMAASLREGRPPFGGGNRGNGGGASASAAGAGAASGAAGGAPGDAAAAAGDGLAGKAGEDEGGKGVEEETE